MDQLDALRLFVTAVDEGGLARAAVRMGRSAAAVSRAIAGLEGRLGVQLLHRTTRTMTLSEAGEQYLAVCRRVLATLDEAQLMAAGERAEPTGVLTITAPVAGGEGILRPILCDFMDVAPKVSAQLYLVDRPVNLIEEGMDVALRFASPPEVVMTAEAVGEVRRVVAAAPAYLDARPPILKPADLGDHEIIAMTHFGLDSWSFPPPPGGSVPRAVSFTPRLLINSVRGAIAAAVEGRGVTRLFSYHIARELEAGTLCAILKDDEPPPMPVHLLTPRGRLAVPRVQAFFDFALPRLRAYFADLGES
jgi:DNA-binding transcriptional LysR family regulator